jgi:murein DD-endopeptidase MepM/ murein hydrolase activator NlpD
VDRIRSLLKRLSTPVTILLVPHSRSRTVSVRVPVVAVGVSVVTFLVGTVFFVSLTARAVEYGKMEQQLSYFKQQFLEMKGTMLALKQSEKKFRELFSMKTKSAVLELAEFSDTGSLDMGMLRKQIDASMRTVTEIRQYIVRQKDIYLATPLGWPVHGRISSHYGFREHPITGERKFHTGVDISAPPGTDVTATADGVVSFSGWTENGGIVVILEHGYGLSTAYAHNQKSLVRVGQHVTRGETIALSGTTGLSTGPHVHYEIWKKGAHINPESSLARR